MNENSNKIKKIPILSYLCCLLAVSVLFTGVTFSRYSSSTSGDVASSLVPYIASYEIDNISATNFPNTAFWLSSEENKAVGTPRTVRYVMRNFEEGENGVQRINALDLQGSIRLYVPAELAQNLALQVEQVQEGATGTAVTPQYVLADLFKLKDGGTWETVKSRDYSALASEDEQLTVTGSLHEGSGSLVAQAKDEDGQGNTVTVSAFSQTVQYSVGFQRGVPTGMGSTGGAGTLLTDLQPQLFIDLEKETDYYAIDITLPEEMRFTGGAAQERTFVLYITLTEAIPQQDSDFNIEWNETDGYLQTPAAGGSVMQFSGAKVLGYHFDVKAQTYTLEGTDRKTSTTVRVTKSYGIDEAGNQYTGTASLSFSHVAPISEGAVNYVHPIENFYADMSGTEASAPADIDEAQSLYGICTNLNGTAGAYYISFSGVPDNPHHAVYGESDEKYQMSVSLSKSYPTRLTAIFVQASQSPVTGAEGEVSV